MSVLLLATTVSAVAHRAIPEQPDDDLIGYLAAGGTIADLCGDTDAHHLARACDACRIVDHAMVPGGATQTAFTCQLPARLALPDAPAFQRLIGDPARTARAPPFV
ncbi:MAG: hypothetical protein AAGF56_01435 [Pseudomonadota bacterium]